MARKFSKRLVIDASVIFSTGRENPDFPSPKLKRCRDFLLEVFDICHRAVLTPEIKAEWQRHQTAFARNWLSRMERKGKVERLTETSKPLLRAELDDLEATDKQRQAMLKDALLIEAALASDSLIASLDQTARKLFAEAAGSIRELKKVVWVNPEIEEEDCLDWLRRGARPEKKRQLLRLSQKSLSKSSVMKFDELDEKMGVFETAHDILALPGLYLAARIDGRSAKKKYIDQV